MASVLYTQAKNASGVLDSIAPERRDRCLRIAQRTMYSLEEVARMSESQLKLAEAIYR